MNVISIEERDANFHKIWLGHVIQSLDLISNKKVKLAFWLLDQMNCYNQITMTYRQIASKSGFSIDTVKRTMKVLIESNFLVSVNLGVYQVNPDIAFKGGKENRMNILLEYNEAKFHDGKCRNKLGIYEGKV